MGRLQALLSCYRDACSHVAKLLIHEAVRLKGGRAAAAKNAEYEVSHFCPASFSRWRTDLENQWLMRQLLLTNVA